MKIIVLNFLFSILVFASIPPSILNNIDAEAIIIKDLRKKEIIYSKDASKRIAPASLTKIVTATLALTYAKPYSIVTITPEMVDVEPTKLNLKVGERFYLIDLIKAALIGSSNDAAMAIGIFIGGNNENFAKMMNSFVYKLGAINTNFTNPCGFDIGNHYSSAQDLLKIAEFAIKIPLFNEIVKMKSHTFRALNTKREYKVYTSNKLLRSYPHIVGIKTGYTHKAGPCYIGRSRFGNEDMLVIMLNASNRWKVAKVILDEVLDSQNQIVSKPQKRQFVNKKIVSRDRGVQNL